MIDNDILKKRGSENVMKKFWCFIKPTFLMLIGFVLAVLIQAVMATFIDMDALPELWRTVIMAVVCAIIILLLGISVDREKCKFGFIPMIILLIAFAVINIFAGDDTILGFISIVGNWEFSVIRMIWYNAADYVNVPNFVMQHELLANATSLAASVIIVPSFMLLGSLFHKSDE